jgi:AcrR family transcriptional regulator
MANPAWSKRSLDDLDDAQREAFHQRRRQLLVAAAEVASRLGAAITMADVAREAGLGMSSVYRTFASKEELLEALLAERVQQWMGVWDIAEARPEPGPALIEALWAFAELEHRDIGLASVLRELALAPREQIASPEVQALIAASDAAGGRLLAGAQAAGAIRDDLEYGDILRIFGMLAAIGDERGWRRALALHLDGLGAPPGSRGPLRP